VAGGIHRFSREVGWFEHAASGRSFKPGFLGGDLRGPATWSSLASWSTSPDWQVWTADQNGSCGRNRAAAGVSQTLQSAIFSSEP